jgi:hypothetical protein
MANDFSPVAFLSSRACLRRQAQPRGLLFAVAFVAPAFRSPLFASRTALRDGLFDFN